MNCPVCGGKALVSYSFIDHESVYRERTCRECRHVFYTTECESGKYEHKKLLSDRDRKRYLRRKQNQ